MKTIFLMLLVTTFFYACKKEPVTEPPEMTSNPPQANYTPLTAGSFWVYDWYQIDSSGNSTFMNKTDSAFVSGDTLIGANTYSILEGNFFGGNSMNKRYLRDSLGYLVSDHGIILFSSTNFTDTLRTHWDAFYFSFWKMDDIGLIISVPAGTWPTLNYKQTVIQTNGTFACGNNIDYENNYYADGIGLVLETIFFFGSNSCQYFEKRLVNYYIHPNRLRH